MQDKIGFDTWVKELEERRRRGAELLSRLDLSRFPRTRPRSEDEEKWLEEREAREKNAGTKVP